jgi:hypothetical protein
MKTEKIYCPGCFDPFECPADFYETLVNAKLWFDVDRVNLIAHITCRNTDSPLTDDDKKRLTDLLAAGGYKFRVVFEN